MLCKRCKSEWRTDQNISATLVHCPFCNEDLSGSSDDAPNTFINSKDALAYIAQQHGYTALLGAKMKTLFTDYAPQLPKRIRNLVFAVHENGAAAVLRDNINSSQADKEIAVAQAISMLTEAFISQEAAENIIYEFAAALKWRASAPLASAPLASAPLASAPLASALRVGAPKYVTAQPLPSAYRKSDPLHDDPLRHNPKSKIYYPVYTGIAAKILRGERRYLQFGEYKWRVLDVQDNRSLLITEDIIEKRPYNSQYIDIAWSACTLRRYLNGEFLSKFSKMEQLMIVGVANAGSSNQWYTVKGGDSTTDKVFLLSAEETVKYFGDSGQFNNWKPGNLGFINDRHNKARSANFRNEIWWWWLRTPGSHGYNAANVSKHGQIIMNGNYVDNWEGGIRPAVWINLNLKSYIFYRRK